MSFDMTEAQKQAFHAATNGTSASTYSHVIFFLIAVFATVWVILVFLGSSRNKDKDVGRWMSEFVFAIGLFIITGVLIYFT